MFKPSYPKISSQNQLSVYFVTWSVIVQSQKISLKPIHQVVMILNFLFHITSSYIEWDSMAFDGIEKKTSTSLINTFTNRVTQASKSITALNIQTMLQNYGWTCVSPCYDK